jgi:hypothetical protein
VGDVDHARGGAGVGGADPDDPGRGEGAEGGALAGTDEHHGQGHGGQVAAVGADRQTRPAKLIVRSAAQLATTDRAANASASDSRRLVQWSAHVGG